MNDKIAVFQNRSIRRMMADGEWYFSVIDVITALTESVNPRDYWFKMKQRVHSEDGFELSTICRQLKLQAPDGKMRLTDCSNVKGLFRIIQSVPSPKAEPFKQWLAQVGSPEAVNKAKFSPIRPTLIPPHGGYSKLVTYRLGVLIYDATAAFCAQYISKRDRTYDQMVQAARSGVANIVEGSEAGAAGKKDELRLTNIAKGSQEELLFDYKSFLRQRELPLWQSDSPMAQRVRNSRPADLAQVRQIMAELVRNLSDKSDKSDKSDRSDILLEVACNTMITLINQETYLLKRQVARLAKDFEQNGGFSERLYRVRSEYRKAHPQSPDQSDRSDKQN